MIKRIREEKGGFTLAELLIVVAIILVLVAVAVPVFTSAMNDADKAVQNANIRSVKAQATTEILTHTGQYGDPVWALDATVSSTGDITALKITGNQTAGTDTATKNADGSYTIVAYLQEATIEKG